MEKKIPDEVELEREEDEDETLSLSDLPLIHKKEEETCKGKENETQEEDFDFCSLSSSKQPEMCAADEVFFKGQILPLRSSVSSERGSLLVSSSSSHYSSMMSRSESMDRFHSGTGGLISSRSSSISSSHQSSSSGSSSRPKLPPARNHFHSHPSPSPKIHFQGNTINNNIMRNYKKTSLWNVFRLGVLTPPPEIAFQDLKPRSMISAASDSKGRKTSRSLIGGCACSADAVETVVVINRSASESELDAFGRVNNVEASPMKKRAAKKQLSHHRTFEWLKQLDLA